MKQKRFKTLVKRVMYGLFATVLLFSYYPNIASANPITPRKVTLGSSLASANTTYSFVFTVPRTTVIQSVGFAACTTASGACTPAPGFSSSTSTLTAQPTNLGDAAGWTVNTATSTELRLAKSGNVAAPTGSQTVGFSGVVNPSNTNQTFFVRITTYSSATWTGAIDTGVVAASTAGQITATAVVDETLNFTLATATVDLGTLTKTSTGVGTSSMTVGTNASTGYSVTYSGTTLTSGTNTINPMTVAAGSTMNSKQFGINLMSNTTPAVGSNVSGGGSGTVSLGYNSQNQFKFNVAGETIASAIAPTNDNVFTTSYIANIDSATAAGSYTAVLTYVVTANF